jgi:hypothetical protein
MDLYDQRAPLERAGYLRKQVAPRVQKTVRDRGLYVSYTRYATYSRKIEDGEKSSCRGFGKPLARRVSGHDEI